MLMKNDDASTKKAGGDFPLSDAERQPCEIWTRVMGYHRPVSSFNRGKKGEFYERRPFTENAAADHKARSHRGDDAAHIH
jgi:hypothetical protein